jgi:hypothetical protein
MEPTGLELWLTVVVGWALIFAVIYLIWDRVLRPPTKGSAASRALNHSKPPKPPRPTPVLDRLTAVLVYYLGGVAVCGAIAVGNGVNGHPYWYSLIAPAVYTAGLAFMDGPEFPLPPKKAAISLGLASFVISTAGYLLGPAL